MRTVPSGWCRCKLPSFCVAARVPLGTVWTQSQGCGPDGVRQSSGAAASRRREKEDGPSATEWSAVATSRRTPSAPSATRTANMFFPSFAEFSADSQEPLHNQPAGAHSIRSACLSALLECRERRTFRGSAVWTRRLRTNPATPPQQQSSARRLMTTTTCQHAARALTCIVVVRRALDRRALSPSASW